MPEDLAGTRGLLPWNAAVALVPNLYTYDKVSRTFTISTGDGEGCGICRSSFLLKLECGVLCTLCPKTRNGAAIAFDIEGHNSEVATAIP